VVVRLQAWGRPQPGERRLLHLRRGTGALVREVELHCAGRPWVFARTLIPPVSLRGAGRRLARLRDRPLGAVLFADPGVQRGPVEVARLLPQHLLFRRAAASLVGHPPLLWARRTLFYMAGRPLLINEVFLPELPSS
jgi:chorismate--pyruvate lyase